MRIGLVCVGRLKSGPERELYARYAKRIASMRALNLIGLDLREIDESRARRPEDRIAQEAALISGALPEGSTFAIFDERGPAATSIDFARFIEKHRDRGAKTLTFAIGGSEGLGPELRAGAAAAFSFGAMTLPHQLVRALAAEQIYRAMTILSGHPYHRE